MSDTPPPDSAVAAAQANADLARARLMTTLGELQERISPRSIVHDVADGLRERGTALGGEAVTLARRRPLAVSGVAAALALFVTRKRIAALLRRDETPARVTSLITERARARSKGSKS